MKISNLINLVILIFIIYFVLTKFQKNPSIEFLNDKTIPDDFLNSNLDEKEKEGYMNNIDSAPKTLTTNVDKCANNVDIKAGNYYLADENQVNFQSNVLNTNRFFDIESLNPASNSASGFDQTLPHQQEGSYGNAQGHCFTQPNTGKKSDTEFNEWTYKNELPMNGGLILSGRDGNLKGYNEMDTALAVYDDKRMSYASCSINDSLNCKTEEPDDIRMGMGKPNLEYRMTN